MDEAVSEAFCYYPTGVSRRRTVEHERIYEEVRDLVLLVLLSGPRPLGASVTSEELNRIIT